MKSIHSALLLRLNRERLPMHRFAQFRVSLPIAFTVAGAVFGTIGLEQRAAILNQRLGENQTLWSSTARFHVWPWPYKLAAVLNLPALLGGMLLSVPLIAIRPNLPELAQFAVSLLFVPPLWFWIGSRLDRRFNPEHPLPVSKSPWTLVAIFLLISLGGSVLPLGYVGYIPYGAVLWIAALVMLGKLRQRILR